MDYQPGQLVQLKCEVPDLELHVGQIGVVCSRWCEPMNYYELEFQPADDRVKVHTVLDETQFCPFRRTAAKPRR